MPPIRAASTGTRAGEALGDHQRRAVPPQRRDHRDVHAGQRSGRSSWPNAPASSTTPRRVDARAAAAANSLGPRRGSGRGPRRVAALGGIDQQARALVRIARSRRSRPTSVSADAAGPRSRPERAARSPRPRASPGGTTSIISAGIAGVDQRRAASPRTRPGTSSTPRLEAAADLAQPRGGSRRRRGCRRSGAVAAAVARAVAQVERLGVEVGARAERASSCAS